MRFSGSEGYWVALEYAIILKDFSEASMQCIINVIWDSEAAVYVATSDSVPGLVLESGSFDALVEKVRIAVPELLELQMQ